MVYICNITYVRTRKAKQKNENYVILHPAVNSVVNLQQTTRLHSRTLYLHIRLFQQLTNKHAHIKTIKTRGSEL